jgi:eukaryotic-like serine/threonine-protein kinase
VLYDFREFTLDMRNFELRRGRDRVPLERRVFDLLAYLIRHRTRVVPKSELFREVWSGRVVTEASLSVAMTAARRSLGDNTSHPTFIETHHGRGYRFVAPVVERDHGVLSGGGSVSGMAIEASPFVGRDNELQAIDLAIESTRRGRMRIVLVSGEAGIGKTRFLEEIKRRSEDAGFRVIIGHSPDEAGSPPYWPWTQLLRGYLEAAESEQIPRLTASELQLLTHILPPGEPTDATNGSPRIADHVQARFRMFDGVSRFLERIARRNPLVVALEDIHRSDEASLLLLSFLAGASLHAPLLVVATYRDTTRPRAVGFSDALATLARAPQANLIHLSGLGPADSRSLLQRLTGQEPTAESLVIAIEKTNGNPFFLTHFARHMSLAHAGTRSLGIVSLPDDLLAAVSQHIDALPKHTQEVLSIASAIGTEVPLAVLARVARRSPDLVMDEIEAAIDARVLCMTSGSSTIRFAHALVRDALYQRLRSSERVLLHKAIGDELASLHSGDIEPHLGAIAHHYFEAASVGYADLAITFATRAAHSAGSHFAYEEAADHYSRALELLDFSSTPQDSVRCALLIGLGTQNIRAGRRELGRPALDRAARIAHSAGASDYLAEVALGLAPGVLSIETGVVDTFLIERLEQAIDALRDSAPALRAALMARLSIALHWTGNDEAILELVENALTLAAEAPSEEALVFARHALWFASRGPNGLASRVALARSLVAESSRVHDDDLELVCRLFLIGSLMETGEVVEFDAEVERYSVLAERLRQPQALWYVSMLRAMQALLRGKLLEAEALKTEFVRLGARVGDANAYHSAMAHNLLISFERDQLDTLVPVVSEAVERYPSMIGWRATRAWAYAQVGELDRARVDLDQIATTSFRKIPKRLDWPATIALLSETAAILDDKQSAEQLYEILSPLANRYFVVGLCVLNWGATDRHLGLLAATLEDWPKAELHLSRAVAMNAGIGAVAWHAQSQLDLARLRLRSGSGSHSRDSQLDCVRSAQSTAARLGLPRLEREARALERKLHN